jgi:nitrogen fixation NifU-like protein
MTTFSPQLMDHLKRPRNAGSIPDAHAVGEAGDPKTTNYIKIWIRTAPAPGSSGTSPSSVSSESSPSSGLSGASPVIEKITFKAYGCAPALAAGSALTELAKGKTLSEARSITPEQVETTLGTLPPDRRFCAQMAVEALRDAVNKVK